MDEFQANKFHTNVRHALCVPVRHSSAVLFLAADFSHRARRRVGSFDAGFCMFMRNTEIKKLKGSCFASSGEFVFG